MRTSVHRTLVSGAFAVAVGGGIIAASAATLGGINTAKLGAENTVVAACDSSGIRIDYQHAYNASSQAFVVSSAVVSLIDANCQNQKLDVELTGASGAAVASATQVTVGASGSETVTFATPPLAASVLGSAVVITG